MNFWCKRVKVLLLLLTMNMMKVDAEILVMPKHIVVVEDQPAEFECITESPNEIDWDLNQFRGLHKSPKLFNIYDGGTIPLTIPIPKPTVNLVNNRSILSIDRVSISNAGQYICKNLATSNESTDSAHLTVLKADPNCALILNSTDPTKESFTCNFTYYGNFSIDMNMSFKYCRNSNSTFDFCSRFIDHVFKHSDLMCYPNLTQLGRDGKMDNVCDYDCVSVNVRNYSIGAEIRCDQPNKTCGNVVSLVGCIETVSMLKRITEGEGGNGLILIVVGVVAVSCVIVIAIVAVYLLRNKCQKKKEIQGDVVILTNLEPVYEEINDEGVGDVCSRPLPTIRDSEELLQSNGGYSEIPFQCPANDINGKENEAGFEPVPHQMQPTKVIGKDGTVYTELSNTPTNEDNSIIARPSNVKVSFQKSEYLLVDHTLSSVPSPPPPSSTNPTVAV